MGQNSVTIIDVANLAGVSITTVSRYINGKKNSISSDTQAKIARAIETLNFHPNYSARNLKKSAKTNAVGIISPEFYGYASRLFMATAFDLLTSRGYMPVIFNAGESASSMRECVQASMDIVCGILFRPCSTDLRIFQLPMSLGIPCVMYDRYMPTWEYDAVYYNQAQAVNDMMDHLFLEGYRDVYYLTFPASEVNNRVLRRKAYEEYMFKQYGNKFEAAHFIRSMQDKNSLEQCKKIFCDILAEPAVFGPKVVFFDSQDTLHMIPETIRDLGLSIPKDIGLCGYDFDNWCSALNPTITSIKIPADEVAEKAINILMKRIEQVQSGQFDSLSINVEKIALNPTCIFRESTKRL